MSKSYTLNGKPLDPALVTFKDGVPVFDFQIWNDGVHRCIFVETEQNPDGSCTTRTFEDRIYQLPKGSVGKWQLKIVPAPTVAQENQKDNALAAMTLVLRDVLTELETNANMTPFVRGALAERIRKVL